MDLFKIGSKNYTNNILVPTYKINNQQMATDWTDSNYTKHRDVCREIISGTFTLKFFEIEDYFDFLETIKENKLEDGSIDNLSFYINKENRVRTNVRAFIDFEPNNELPYIGTSDSEGIEITIEER